jgi:hypothetical protein
MVRGQEDETMRSNRMRGCVMATDKRMVGFLELVTHRKVRNIGGRIVTISLGGRMRG